MTAETQPTTDSLTLEERMTQMEIRMARIDGQQEIIIALLKSQDAKLEAMNQRLFIGLASLLATIGAGVITYVVTLLT